MTPSERANAEHLARVHAVHRRSEFERVDNKIRQYEAAAPDALDGEERHTLTYLKELRGFIHDEMERHGQI